jgi:DNA adenine methylase
MTKISTPITWYGGKQMMLKHILPVIPEHTQYVEPFFGGGAVFFSKPPVKAEVINDLNKEAVNFYRTVKVDSKALHSEITTTLHSREAYKDANIVYSYPHMFTPVKRAWAFYTMANQSFSANLSSFAFDRIGSTTLKVHNKREKFNESLAERLSRTTIECDDAIKVITRYDSDTTFHYVDPPYFNSDCGHYKGYTKQDFENLLETLSNVKGKFLLSSYPSDILKEYSQRHGWHSQSFDKTVAVSPGNKKSKTEVLTANYVI